MGGLSINQKKMDFSEEEVLISLKNMEDSESGSDSENELKENGVMKNGHSVRCQNSYPSSTVKVLSLPWFDLRVFYVRVSKCVINDDSTPEFLTLNHVPLNRDTILEANGVRTSIYSDGVSIKLKRDRLDKKSEEVTFVSTDSVRMSGSVKFEVFHKDVMVLFGTVELCHSNGSTGETKNHGPIWNMNCESDIVAADGFFKGNNGGLDSVSPFIEVYVAGCFGGSPIILSKSLQLNSKRKQRKGKLESIPEYEPTQSPRNDSLSLTNQSKHYPDYEQQEESSFNPYAGMEYLEGEDGELSWFNSGVRVGVGIGLSICLGVGIGVGLLARTYQGTARNFRRIL